MTRNKRYAIIGCVLSLVFSIVYGAVGFTLLNGYSVNGSDVHPALPFLYNFFFISLPGVIVMTIIAIVKIKDK